MFSCNPAAYEQHHEILSVNDSILQLIVVSRFNPSISPASRSELRRTGFVKHVRRARILTHHSRRSKPIGFPSLPDVCFTHVSDGDSSLCVMRIRSSH